MRQGLFITLEGVDGVGKTTQAILLKRFLEEKGFNVLHTFEPGGTALGSQIRQLLLDPNNKELGYRTEILLYAADRSQHVSETILPALENGQVVVCERFIDSSVAYQGYGLELDIDAVRYINNWGSAGLTPDLTIYLDADPAESLKKTKGDRIEQRTLEYYTRVRDGFLTIAKQEPDRVHVVSAIGSIEQVATRVREVIGGICP